MTKQEYNDLIDEGIKRAKESLQVCQTCGNLILDKPSSKKEIDGQEVYYHAHVQDCPLPPSVIHAGEDG
jgi:hypothetical protein